MTPEKYISQRSVLVADLKAATERLDAINEMIAAIESNRARDVKLDIGGQKQKAAGQAYEWLTIVTMKDIPAHVLVLLQHETHDRWVIAYKALEALDNEHFRGGNDQ